MAGSIEDARRWYAEELRFAARVRSLAVIDAFAKVPRVRFVGPGPWRIKSPMRLQEYWTTEDVDPRHVYHDALIAFDEPQGINNGQPSLWALLLDELAIAPGEQVLHLGCGTGYYTAIIAELVGLSGKVTALEIDALLADKARLALDPWPQVTDRHADGSQGTLDPVHAIVASAGATHPPGLWLDAQTGRTAAVSNDNGPRRSRCCVIAVPWKRERMDSPLSVPGRLYPLRGRPRSGHWPQACRGPAARLGRCRQIAAARPPSERPNLLAAQ